MSLHLKWPDINKANFIYKHLYNIKTDQMAKQII